MSELKIRRKKIAKQLVQQERFNYFKSRRNELLIEKEQIQTEDDTFSRHTVWLKQIVHRSLVTDGLLQDIQKHSLLQTIQGIVPSSTSCRDIEFILIILSNTLLDNLALVYKQNIAKLCLSCYQIKTYRQYSSRTKESKLLLPIAHNLNSLSKVVNLIDKDLGVKCKQTIFRQTIQILSKLKDQVNYVDQEEQKPEAKLIQILLNTIINLIYCEETFANQLLPTFQRNIASFCQILQIHAQFVLMNRLNPFIKKIHYGMLFIQEYLTSSIPKTNFQAYFESRNIFSIILMEIYQNRDQLLNKAALKILHNLFIQNSNSQTVVFMSHIQSDIHFKDRTMFFKKLLCNDGVKYERMKIIEHFLRNEDAYILFQAFLQSYWRYIVDNCCQMLQNSSNQVRQQVVEILILIKFRYFKDPSYLSYVKSIGMHTLLKEKCRIYEENLAFNCQNSTSEEEYSKIILLLELFDEDQQNSF